MSSSNHKTNNTTTIPKTARPQGTIPRPTSVIGQQQRTVSNNTSGSSPQHQQQQQQQQSDNNMLQRPTSLLASTLPEWKLSSPTSSQLAPPRPRRLWAVNDTSLRPIPSFYPPMDPKCTVYISDASPSVLAVRIAECLRKRSISVEYDEESVIATCMTVDRCHFIIRMYQGSAKNQHPMIGVDFSHGVVVECMRVTGSVLTYHRHCREVLQAAKGQSTGEDRRPNYQTSVLEFRRLKAGRKDKDGNLIQRSRSNVSAGHALEQARELLKKDRLDCQQLGMEQLVGLTNMEVSGEDICMHVSLQLLQDTWLLDHIKEIPSAGVEDLHDKSVTSGAGLLSSCAATFKEADSNQNHSSSMPLRKQVEEESRHDGILRASALRVFCNALGVVSEGGRLDRLLNRKDSPLVARPLLDSLLQDLKGSTRPPSVVLAGSRWASVHEAALSIRCLRILGKHSEDCQDYLQNEKVLERLDTARACGRATHWVLQNEAEFTYSQLTEDVRSC